MARAALGQTYWTSLTCPRCGGLVGLEHTGDNQSPKVLRQVPAGTLDEYKVNDLPDKVERLYREAITVLKAGVPDAAAVQLRRTLEAAAAEFKVPPYPLAKAVKALIDDGHVTSKFGEALGHVRRLGNIAAHASDEPITQEMANQALDFTRQFLRNLFEIPAALARLDDADVAEGELGEGGDSEPA